MVERAKDWLAQADRDLDNAQYNSQGEYYEWACFVAQQAAEKALKAIYQSRGGEAWGHSLVSLVRGLAEKLELPADLLQHARDLDRYYIAARYPNGWAEGAPKDMYSERDAAHAIACAQAILRFSHGLLARS
jgi:HEPN domain-containing protein